MDQKELDEIEARANRGILPHMDVVLLIAAVRANQEALRTAQEEKAKLVERCVTEARRVLSIGEKLERKERELSTALERIEAFNGILENSRLLREAEHAVDSPPLPFDYAYAVTNLCVELRKYEALARSDAQKATPEHYDSPD